MIACIWSLHTSKVCVYIHTYMYIGTVSHGFVSFCTNISGDIHTMVYICKHTYIRMYISTYVNTCVHVMIHVFC